MLDLLEHRLDLGQPLRRLFLVLGLVPLEHLEEG